MAERSPLRRGRLAEQAEAGAVLVIDGGYTAW
jgi:hypothetical protein